jgi:hypothetical protein
VQITLWDFISKLKINRKLVQGGAYAMYQFELFRAALAKGETAEAKSIMKVNFDYNKDHCL